MPAGRNKNKYSGPEGQAFQGKIKQFFLVLSRPEVSSFGIDLAKIISNDILSSSRTIYSDFRCF
jgi:hypothetical protein